MKRYLETDEDNLSLQTRSLLTTQKLKGMREEPKQSSLDLSRQYPILMTTPSLFSIFIQL